MWDVGFVLFLAAAFYKWRLRFIPGGGVLLRAASEVFETVRTLVWRAKYAGVVLRCAKYAGVVPWCAKYAGVEV